MTAGGEAPATGSQLGITRMRNKRLSHEAPKIWDLSAPAGKISFLGAGEYCTMCLEKNQTALIYTGLLQQILANDLKFMGRRRFKKHSSVKSTG